MTTPIAQFTANGTVYTIADFFGYGLYEEVTAGTGDRAPRWVAAYLDIQADMLNQMQTTSISSIAIGTGVKTIVLDNDLPIPQNGGLIGVAIDAADGDNKFYFEVDSYNEGTKTITTKSVSDYDGSGTKASWIIQLGIGQKGANGGVSALAALDDVSLGAQALDDFLLWNGTADWVNVTVAATLAKLEAQLTAGTVTASKFIRASAGKVIDVLGITDLTSDKFVPKNVSYAVTDKGTVTSGTVTFSLLDNIIQRLQVGGALTVAFSNWVSLKASKIDIQLVNGGAFTVTWPTINWYINDGSGATTTTFSAALYNLKSSGTDFVTIWTPDGGTTLYGKVVV